jgi:hypothetical protein
MAHDTDLLIPFYYSPGLVGCSEPYLPGVGENPDDFLNPEVEE